MRIDPGKAEVLAVRGIAELKAIHGMAAAKMHGKGARGHGHRLQGFVGLEVSGLARQHSGDVLLHRNDGSDQEMTIVGAKLNGEVGVDGGIAGRAHLVSAADAKLGECGFVAIDLKRGAGGMHSENADGGVFTTHTFPHLRLAAIGVNS